MKVPVVMRSFDVARTGANTNEEALTPQHVGSNLLRKLFSLKFDDDPRLEAQPLYVPGVHMSDGKTHDIVYICTMANNVWAFDANDGALIWKKGIGEGHPITPKPNPGGGNEIDLFEINIKWGVLSTPVIDIDTKTMFIVNWSSSDKSVAKAIHQLHAIDITSGNPIHPALTIAADASAQGAPAIKFISWRQKQRASLLLTSVTDHTNGAVRKTLFVACGMTHEENDPTHGWVLAYDTAEFKLAAAWCTAPNGHGTGIWQAGQGPSADENGDIYVMTGNYGQEDHPPAAGDLPESFVKLHYTAPSAGAAAKLEAVAWFTPFNDADRNPNGQDNFQDYDLGSGGPLPIPGMSLVVGAGKDGVLYLLDKDTTKFGKGSNFGVLKQQPIFFTYFPGFGIDASQVHNLDRLWDGKTHHLHGSPIFWQSPTHGPMLCVWGENECLRAWTLDAGGKVTFLAKSAEIASAGLGGKGGMPGGLLAVSANGTTAGTGIVWALAPIHGDANRHVVQGILRAYDATNLDPISNTDGTPRLKLLWDSNHIPNNAFNHSKFCPPIVTDGKVFVPTYDGKVDVYGLVLPARGQPRPSNATRIHRHH